MKIILSYLLLLFGLLVQNSNAVFDKYNYTEQQWIALKSEIASQLSESLFQYLQQQGAPGGCIALNLGFESPIDVCTGLADISQNISIKPDMHYRIASTTKTFTAAGILKLAEQNKLSLNDTIDKYFPDINIPNKDAITIYHLLHMSSGLYNYLNDYYTIASLQTHFTPIQLIEAAISHDVEFLPGQGYSYSNTNYVILGVIIEQVSGKSYAQYIEDEFLLVLGLTETYEPQLYTTTLREPYAKGYVKTAEGDEEIYEFDSSLAFATGSMVSTVQEMTEWTRALLTGEILGENSMKELLDFSVETDFGYYGGGLEKFEASKLGMEALPANNLVGKVANIMGYTSIMTYDIDDDISLVVFINYENEMQSFLTAEMAMISLQVIKQIMGECLINFYILFLISLILKQ